MTLSTLGSEGAESVILAGVYMARGLVVDRQLPSVGRGLAIGGSQFVYAKTVRDKVRAYLAQLTGEQMFSGLLADSMGLAGALYVVSMLGVTSPGELAEGSVIPRVGGSPFINSIAESAELIIEKNLAIYALGMSGYSVDGSALPVAALPK
jgi:hypothetical protein